jgi:16S rRNA (cytosine1402-N4)-methyltransferase
VEVYIDFQIINFTRPEGGDNTSSISPTDNAVKLFMWKSIAMEFEHISVMAQEVHEHLNLKHGHICVDCTLGGAGHAFQSLQAIGQEGLLIGIDQDADAILHAEKRLNRFKDNVRLFHNNFADLPFILNNCGIKGVNAILLDLGFSLNQIKNSGRGFSFKQNEPLDMRMDIRNSLTAFEIVNSFPENELADIFFQYGEERFSRRIAKKIVQKRALSQIKTADRLAQIISDAIPRKRPKYSGHRGKKPIHPATKVFQALRIAVNKELDHLEKFMADLPSLLLKDGRLCVISFHSLEDRIVKQSLRRYEKGCTCPTGLPVCVCGSVPLMKSVFRKALLPSKTEIEQNPMARSARLRVAKRI